MRQSGHSPIKVAVDRYGNLLPGRTEAPAARLDELRFGNEFDSRNVRWFPT
jgi:hypothetical protein